MIADPHELHQRARTAGYLSSNCDSCDATGRSLMLAATPPAGAAPVIVACPDCAGTGRWWYPEKRRTGVAAHHLTDVGLRDVLRRAARQEAGRGNQG
jgi:hypothetical protein